jgi:dynein heavy chain
MNSNEKEKVPLKKIVKARGQIEIWLDQLQQEMINTLTSLMKQGLQDYEKSVSDDAKNGRKTFVLEHYGQIVACIAQIMWCTMTSQALEEMQNNPFAL